MNTLQALGEFVQQITNGVALFGFPISMNGLFDLKHEIVWDMTPVLCMFFIPFPETRNVLQTVFRCFNSLP